MKGRDPILQYRVAFVSLGCAKNQVNCEQMMAAVTGAGAAEAAAPVHPIPQRR